MEKNLIYNQPFIRTGNMGKVERSAVQLNKPPPKDLQEYLRNKSSIEKRFEQLLQNLIAETNRRPFLKFKTAKRPRSFVC